MYNKEKNSEEKRIALLIDAENVPSKHIAMLFEELNQYGNVTIRRVYGDWSKNTIRDWLELTPQYSLIPMMQENNTPGKNASDICLVIDAMKLLYENKADIFCIVSSDSDFTLLAKTIRENGLPVIGMGEMKTPQAFINACWKFIFLDVISAGESEDDDSTEEGNYDKNVLTDKKEIEKAIIEIIKNNDNKGKITGLGEIGSILLRMYPEFDVRNYGYSKLSTFIKDMEKFAVEEKDSRIYVKINRPLTRKEIEKAIAEIIKNNEQKGKPTEQGELGSKLHTKYPGFNVKDYGYSNLSIFLSNDDKLVVTEKGKSKYVELREKKKK